MVGIKSCGVYVPLWRMDLASAKEGWRGERAIANFDEDSLTMGVAAAINCLKGVDRKTIDGLYFASSTFPYKEKQVSVIAATTLDLRSDVITADFGNSLRAGTNALRAAVDALKSGTVKQILVIASDMRLPMPGSDFEREFGDGAAAVLLSSTEAKVEIKGGFSVADEIFDVWRTDEDKFVRTWEERFTLDEGYFRVLPNAVSGLMKKVGLTSKDFARAVFNGPNARRHSEMGKKLGFAETQLQPPLFGSVGDTGNASALMMLAAALEKTKAGDKVLLANYGSGADAFLLEVKQEVGQNITLAEYIASKAVLKDYKRYLNWRGLVEMAMGRRRPPTPSPSATCLWREIDQNMRLQGVKCQKCGMVQYPPQTVCFNCKTVNQFESYSLYDKKGKLTTFTEDMATPNPDPPLVLAVVDFEGGGRIWFYMTDKGGKKLEIGMPVEVTFRKLFTNEGIHNYFWKCLPGRSLKEG